MAALREERSSRRTCLFFEVKANIGGTSPVAHRPETRHRGAPRVRVRVARGRSRRRAREGPRRRRRSPPARGRRARGGEALPAPCRRRTLPPPIPRCARPEECRDGRPRARALRGGKRDDGGQKDQTAGVVDGGTRHAAPARRRCRDDDRPSAPRSGARTLTVGRMECALAGRGGGGEAREGEVEREEGRQAAPAPFVRLSSSSTMIAQVDVGSGRFVLSKAFLLPSVISSP